MTPTWKYSTGRYNQYMLRFHVYPTLGDMQLRLITRDVVQNFLSVKLRSGLSWRTVKGMRTTLGALMAAAENAALIPSNPVRKTRFPRRGPMKQKAVIAPEKIRELLDALPEPSRSLAWLLVLTGLRIGELLALRWQNVDLENGVLRVVETVYDGHFDTPKTQRSQRSVPLGPMAVRILSARKLAVMNPEALVFSTRDGSPFDRHNLTRRQLKSTCQKLGIERVSWHWLRHANATLLDAVGTPLGTVQALLGHSSSEITRQVYLHSIPADARKAVEKVEETLNRLKLTQVPEDWGKGSSLIQ
jgi:integrase